jgi:flagellar motor switch protein FliG
MRNELAMMAAHQSFKEKLNPLPFLKVISDDDLAKLLDASSLKELAMIATLVPAHRLTRFFETHPQISYKDLLTEVALLEDLEPEHFVPLQLRLEAKLQKISTIVVTKDQKVNSIKQLIISIKHPKIQTEAARSTFFDQPKLFEDIRPSLILIEDFINLPQRAAKVLFQSVDGEALGTAWSGLTIDVDFISGLLPEAIKETFVLALAQTPEPVDQCHAWQKILTHFEDLKASGLISSSEIRLAQQKTDRSWSASISQNPGDDGSPLREAA